MLNSGRTMAERISAELLWQFSLAFYPKVKPVCLLWQDELGANVNLMLLLCYLEQQQLSFRTTELQQLAAKLENFSAQFTRPLRQLRRSASDAGLNTVTQQQLKQTLLATELQLEQLEQQLLLQHCPPLLAQPALPKLASTT